MSHFASIGNVVFEQGDAESVPEGPSGSTMSKRLGAKRRNIK
jgi:hypothetical protein